MAVETLVSTVEKKVTSAENVQPAEVEGVEEAVLVVPAEDAEGLMEVVEVAVSIAVAKVT